MSENSVVKSHWYHPVANFHTSTQEFYAAVEQALGPRQIPGLAVSRIAYKEGGVFSASREYLRVQREKLVFDICAAPFGTGYFFSSWLAEKRKYGFWLFLGAMALIFIMFLMVLAVFQGMFGNAVDGFGAVMVGPLAALAMPVIVFVIGYFIHAGAFGDDVEDSVLETAVLGWVYEKIFGPGTYFRVDTQLMFQSAVHATVLEVVDSVLAAMGVRELSVDERKPTMNDFFKR